MSDRSSRPHHSPSRTSRNTEQRIIKLRVTLSLPKNSSGLVSELAGADRGRRGRWAGRVCRPRGMMSAVLLRLSYLAVSNTFTVLRLLPMGDRDEDVEILALRHQIAVLERQLGQ
jgi:hypothetical protein